MALGRGEAVAGTGVKLQILCGDEIAIGPGKADLLDTIRAEGSISGAARALGISYRRAWLLVDAMNRCWREPLVATTPGGVARGGGSRLTVFGGEVLARYRDLQHWTRFAAGSPMRALDAALLPRPRPRRRDDG